MTISGSDSGGGAGIQTDLKTFNALGVYGTSVVTAVTAQNTIEIAAIAEVPDEVVIAQIDTVAEDVGAHAVKTGMLVNRSIVQNVADRLEAWGISFLVVDPVMVSQSGATLLRHDAVTALKSELIPKATIVTPSVSEARVLAGREIDTFEDVREAARMIHALGPQIVVIKGGHFPGPAIDLVFDGSEFLTLDGDTVDAPDVYGSGCTFSAAITAFLAQGADGIEAIQLAKLYVDAALETSFSIGSGRRLVNHPVDLPHALRFNPHAPVTDAVS